MFGIALLLGGLFLPLEKLGGRIVLDEIIDIVESHTKTK